MNLKFSLLFIFLAVVKIASSQPVTVSFIHQHEKASRVMTGLSPSYLLTESDSINLDKILSLNFSETLPDSLSLVKLNHLGIYVYLKDKRYKSKVKDNAPEFNSPVSLGLGFGLDFGGIGMKVSVFPTKPIGAFVGIGSNLQGLGWNAGIDWKFKSIKRTSGFMALMYGYNAVTDIETNGVQQYKDTYYGLSAQLGARIRAGKKNNFFTLGIIVPVIQHEDIKEIKKLYGDDLDYSPVLISFGFHFGKL